MQTSVVVSDEVFVREIGSDGKQYVVVPLMWTLEAINTYHSRFEPYNVFSDEIPKGREGFEQFVLNSAALWFEVIEEETGTPVGVVFVADFVQSNVENRFLSASYHVSMWDSRFSTRLPVQKAFVRALFARFKLHRLEMEIPLWAGGAIRMAKKAGFIPEGVRREARRYQGEWCGVLHLAMLESEVP